MSGVNISRGMKLEISIDRSQPTDEGFVNIVVSARTTSENVPTRTICAEFNNLLERKLREAGNIFRIVNPDGIFPTSRSLTVPANTTTEQLKSFLATIVDGNQEAIRMHPEIFQPGETMATARARQFDPVAAGINVSDKMELSVTVLPSEHGSDFVNVQLTVTAVRPGDGDIVTAGFNTLISSTLAQTYSIQRDTHIQNLFFLLVPKDTLFQNLQQSLQSLFDNQNEARITWLGGTPQVQTTTTMQHVMEERERERRERRERREQRERLEQREREQRQATPTRLLWHNIQQPRSVAQYPDIENITNTQKDAFREAVDNWRTERGVNYECPISLNMIQDNDKVMVVFFYDSNQKGRFEVYKADDQTINDLRSMRETVGRALIKARQEFSSMHAFTEFLNQKYSQLDESGPRP